MMEIKIFEENDVSSLEKLMNDFIVDNPPVKILNIQYTSTYMNTGEWKSSGMFVSALVVYEYIKDK